MAAIRLSHLKYIGYIESSGSAAEHNLDLSLGNSSSKQNGVALGNDGYNAAVGQNSMLMPLEADWRNQGFRPNKVLYLTYSFILILNPLNCIFKYAKPINSLLRIIIRKHLEVRVTVTVEMGTARLKPCRF